MNKLAFSILAVLLAAGLITASLSFDFAEAKKVKPVKCQNVKINVKVNGVQENQTVSGVVTLNNVDRTKSAVVEENETDVTLPFSFKKLNPCPSVGDDFFGDINGTAFSGELKSLKKPTKVTVALQ